MIDKATAIPTLLRKLAKLEVGHAIDVRTYKRNRSVVITRTGEDAFEVIECGFHEERYVVQTAGMKKLLKTLLKREFPRSTKMRVYDLGPADTSAPLQRKKI